MEDTAEGLGMEVSPLIDQRRDPERSTAAAVSFLAELHHEFGSWFFALAAYNSGPNRVRRILRTYASGEQPSDSLFWALRRRFPAETRDFVPKLIGAIVVARDPASHGYDAPVVGAVPLRQGHGARTRRRWTSSRERRPCPRGRSSG